MRCAMVGWRPAAGWTSCWQAPRRCGACGRVSCGGGITMDEIEVLRVPSRMQPSSVFRKGDVVYRNAGHWTPAVHALLRYLEAVGFEGAPRLVGTGLDAEGREMLTYIPGEFTQPG